ncbi:hypothetical protein Tco_1264737 [Tanacetum coccineum]
MLGGQVCFMLLAASPLSANVLDIQRVCFGCIFLEAYGMTENSCAISNIDLGDNLCGDIGSPSLACEINNCVPGYYKDEFHSEDVNEGKHSRTSSSKERGNDEDMIQKLAEKYMDHLGRGKSKGTAKNPKLPIAAMSFRSSSDVSLHSSMYAMMLVSLGSPSLSCISSSSMLSRESFCCLGCIVIVLIEPWTWVFGIAGLQLASRIVVEGTVQDWTLGLEPVSSRLFCLGLKVYHLPPASSISHERARSSNNAQDSLAFLSRSLPLADVGSMVRLLVIIVLERSYASGERFSMMVV